MIVMEIAIAVLIESILIAKMMIIIWIACFVCLHLNLQFTRQLFRYLVGSPCQSGINASGHFNQINFRINRYFRYNTTTMTFVCLVFVTDRLQCLFSLHWFVWVLLASPNRFDWQMSIDDWLDLPQLCKLTNELQLNAMNGNGSEMIENGTIRLSLFRG